MQAKEIVSINYAEIHSRLFDKVMVDVRSHLIDYKTRAKTLPQDLVIYFHASYSREVHRSQLRDE